MRACCMKYIVHVHFLDDVKVLQLERSVIICMCVCALGEGRYVCSTQISVYYIHI